MNSPMNIAIIGSGNVGGALGKAWATRGHHVVFGVQDVAANEVRDLLAAAGPTASAATPADAAAAAPIVFIALPWPVVPAVLPALGDLTGKIVVDCTNPVGPGLRLAIGHTTSGGEEVAKLVPGARVVKGFHTVGAENMANPRIDGRAIVNFLCSDDAEAKQVAATLSAELGWQPVDAGPLAQARLTEPLAMLWITLAFQQGLGRDFGFTLLERQPMATRR